MADPKKIKYDANSFEYESPRIFSDFQRIQVKNQRSDRSGEYQDLPRTRQQELVERLIDRVRDL